MQRRWAPSRPSIAVSALLHVLLVAALLFALHQRPPHEAMVPPSSFAVVFEHGGAPRTRTPRAEKSPLPIPPSVAQPPSAPESAAPPQKPAPPVPVKTAPPVPTPPAPAAPSPAPPSPGEFAVRLPTPSAEAPALRAPLAPLAPLRPSPQKERAAPAPPQRTPAHPPPQAPRYLVMNRMSFGDPGQSRAPPRRGLNLALNRSVLNGEISNDFAIEGKIGPDWRAELARWVNERKYYPRNAIEMGQQGAVQIQFVVARNGQVRSVSLLRSSGSPFLDQAWLTLFRGATLPAFPAGTKADELTIRATMHYILIDG